MATLFFLLVILGLQVIEGTKLFQQQPYPVQSNETLVHSATMPDLPSREGNPSRDFAGGKSTLRPTVSAEADVHQKKGPWRREMPDDYEFKIRTKEADPSMIRWSEEWFALGPFPISQLANPLQENTEFPPNASVPYFSELVNDGEVRWKPVVKDKRGMYQVLFTGINEDLIVPVYGLTGDQWRAMVSGYLYVQKSGTYILGAQGVRSLKIGSITIAGDVYSDGRGYFPLTLAEGSYPVHFMLGGYGLDTSTFNLLPIRIETTSQDAYWMPNDIIMPDIVNGQLSSPYISAIMVSTATEDVQDFTYSVMIRQGTEERTFHHQFPHLVVPGKPVEWIIDLSLYSGIMNGNWSNCDDPQVFLTVKRPSWSSGMMVPFQMSCLTFQQPYRYTFLDKDLSTQFAAVYPPKETCPTKMGCPIIFSTHGAGVMADSEAWTYAYKQQKQAYILFPTNRRRYGYDWETSGYVNGLEALRYFSENLPGVPHAKRDDYKADFTRRIYTGHSMGGHGCWVYATHEPDYALGALPVSGWIRHELYLPYYMKYDIGYVDHHVRSLLHGSLQEYDADIYADHLKGIPVMVRYGVQDDNVPPLLMRRMAQILKEINHDPSLVKVNPVAGAGHWWDTVVNDNDVNHFFEKAYLPSQGNKLQPAARPPLPLRFQVKALNPANMAGRGGLRILQQWRTHQMSILQVDRGLANSTLWNIKGSNVKRFQWLGVEGLEYPKNGFNVDGTSFLNTLSMGQIFEFCQMDEGGDWEMCSEDAEWKQYERSPSTYGPARQIFERGPIAFVFSEEDPVYKRTAISLSQSMYIQGRFTPAIISESLFFSKFIHNEQVKSVQIIYLGPSHFSQFHQLVDLPVSLKHQQRESKDFIELDATKGFHFQGHHFVQPKYGALFLAPAKYSESTVKSSCTEPSLVLMVVGNSVASFEQAAKLIPLTSSSMIPDYVVVDANTIQVKGMDGLVATGYWSYDWKFDPITGYFRSF